MIAVGVIAPTSFPTSASRHLLRIGRNELISLGSINMAPTRGEAQSPLRRTYQWVESGSLRMGRGAWISNS